MTAIAFLMDLLSDPQQVLKQLYFPGNDFDYIYYAPSTENVEDMVDLLRMDLQIAQEREYY